MQHTQKGRRQPTRAGGVGGIPMDMDFVSRRIKRHLNDLERNNYTEPTSGPGQYGEDGEAKVTSLRGSGEGEDGGRKKKKTTQNVRTLLVYRKNLQTLIDESNLASAPKTRATYLTASAPPSRRPPLVLCSVCGYKGNYTCQRCGLKYCDRGCRGIHDDSRCERRG